MFIGFLWATDSISIGQENQSVWEIRPEVVESVSRPADNHQELG